MPCPICGRIYCDHTPAERGQTVEEMLADMQADSEKTKAAQAEKPEDKEEKP